MEEDQVLASFAKALGNPARVAILRHLQEVGTASCGDLVQVLPLSQATVSQHLAVLKGAGLIAGQPSGTQVIYRIAAEALRSGASSLDAFARRPIAKTSLEKRSAGHPTNSPSKVSPRKDSSPTSVSLPIELM